MPNGPIPEEWCNLLEREDSRLNVIHPGNNQLVCGEVPECFHNTTKINFKHVVGSCLVYPDNGLRDYPGGACDSTPPDCASASGCLFSPSIVNKLDYFRFNYSSFVDEESGISAY
eukprot:scaffold174499_cov45-Prasinocladus_malaysianus.AAC.1